MMSLSNNVKDVALIFEGGGMRNSYSSAVVVALLENEIHFDAVYGVSAGATNAINYVSRDAKRSRLTFTAYTDGLPFKKGVALIMNSGRIGPFPSIPRISSNDRLPFDFATFQANPARLTLEGLNRDTGGTTYWTREDFPTQDDLFARVEASTSYPIIMPPVKLEGKTGGFYYDGGPGEGGGIMVPRARTDGFSKYFVVRTQPKGFRKRRANRLINDVFFWRRPSMRKALATWAKRYNEQLDQLETLEAKGRAYVFYAKNQSVTNRELTYEKLEENYRSGYHQAQRELDAWAAFLNL